MPRQESDQSLAVRVRKQRSFYKPELSADPARMSKQKSFYKTPSQSSSSTSTSVATERHRQHHHNMHSPRPRGRPPIQYDEALPRSVRHAPTELRAIIRRRQNNESAKRCREREREHMEAIEQKYEENQRRIEDLEHAVDTLSSELGPNHRMM